MRDVWKQPLSPEAIAAVSSLPDWMIVHCLPGRYGKETHGGGAARERNPAENHIRWHQ